ncbi:MAG TPA: hypothetical protein VFX01_06360 [Methylophilaceae bacterium]|nr:hypothetical protein [Methylophilaceae bacterium]
MTKLSEYVEIASSEYLNETGKTVLDSRWVAEFFQDSGVLDEYPRQDVVAFAELVQKSLTRQYEAARRKRQLGVDHALRFINRQRKP